MGITTLRRRHAAAALADETLEESPSQAAGNEPSGEDETALQLQRELDELNGAIAEQRAKLDELPADHEDRESQQKAIDELEAQAAEKQDEIDESQVDASEARAADDEKPPLAGPGSGVKRWRAYALKAGKTEDEIAGLTAKQISGLFVSAD